MIRKTLVVVALVCAIVAFFGISVLGLGSAKELAVGVGILAALSL